MGLIEFIKKFFSKFNLKKLPVGNLTDSLNVNNDYSKDNLLNLNPDDLSILEKDESLKSGDHVPKNDFNTTMLKSEKIACILKKVGCRDGFFEQISKFDDVNINNLKDVLKLLISLKYTKLQINYILDSNPKILYLSKEELDSTITELNNYTNDEEITKRIILYNSSIFNKIYELSIKDVFEILEKNNFSQEEKIELLEENTNIFFLRKERLVGSLAMLKEILGSSYKNIILGNPTIVGVVDKNIVLELLH